jgi:uncharacterized repeat protein (TIGR01451 family)/uncharacterized protein (TIGR03382 family)
LLAYACAVTSIFAALPANAQFPIRQSFRSGNPGSWTVLGGAQFTSGIGDPAGDGWLRLTSGSQYEIGNAIHDAAFPATANIVVSFVYASHGGSAPGADGFAFYLIDGNTQSPTQGASGGSLGYSSEFASCTGTAAAKVAGVASGHLGIGFDEYGDFSDCLWGRGGPGPRPDAVAIRGSGSRFDVNGFPYLTGAQIGAAPFWQPISTGSRAQARPVRVSIANGTVQVEMDFGSGLQVVVPAYDFASAPGQAARPATFKLGFSGSSGWFTGIHEIRDLLVTAPATLTLGHVATPATVSVGGTVTYTVTVSNDDQNPVSGVSFADTVPPGITGVTWSAVAGGGATTSSASGSGNVISSTLDLPRSSSVTFTVTGTASAAAAGTTLAHAATVTPPPDSGQGQSVTASVTVARMATAASLAASTNPSAFGAPVTFTATVSPIPPGSGTPTGTVTFMDGTAALGTSPLSGGIATLATSSLSVGSHAVTAVYDGDAACLGATSPVLAQVVALATPALDLATFPGSPVFGEPLTFRAAVTGAGATPTGTVVFRDGGAMLGTATLSAGVATLDLPWLGTGGHTITAVYGGDSCFDAGEVAVALDVAPGELCLVQSDCTGAQVCVKSTRRGELGLCQPPSSADAASLGCSSAGGGGAFTMLLALLALALAARRRPAIHL